MKLKTLLEDNCPTLKQMMTFCMVLQDCLLTQYPNFPTKIINDRTVASDWPIMLTWEIGDIVFQISISTYASPKHITLYFLTKNYIINNNQPTIIVRLLSSDLTAEKLDIDIPKQFTHQIDRRALEYYDSRNSVEGITIDQLFQKINDGEISSLKPFYLK